MYKIYKKKIKSLNNKINELSIELSLTKLICTKVVEKFKSTVNETAAKASQVRTELNYTNSNCKLAIDNLQSFLKK